MTSLTSFITHYLAALCGLSLGLSTVLLVWLVALSARLGALRRRYETTIGDVEGQDVAAMLTQYLTLVRQMSARSEHVREQVRQIAEFMPTAITHVGLVRFTPFHDTAGDQSFSVALLNARGDGVVLSALHARRDSKLYAKPIQALTSEFRLTSEEQRAIRESFAVRPNPMVGSQVGEQPTAIL